MKKAIVFAAVVAVCVFAYARFSSAQTATDESAFLTWHAGNFYPADFTGKPLPTAQSTLTITVTDIINSKVQDLSGRTVTWYVDGEYYANGTGLETISLPVGKGLGSTYSVRATIQSDGGGIDALSIIPIFKAFAAIDAPIPNLMVPQGTSVALSAIPYFWGVTSINDLSFSWVVNGTPEPSENGGVLTLNVGNMGSGQGITVQSTINNTKSLTQSDQEKITLTTE